MAVIYLKHPQHGAKVAISDMEAMFDEQNGWERYDPDEPQASQDTPTVNAFRTRRRAAVVETQT